MIKKTNLKVAGDLFYTVMATVVMNVVLQIIIYPLITHFYGEDVTGNILYFIGLIYIIPQALGASLSNTRLVIRKCHDAANSDYSMVILIASIASALCCGAIGFVDNQSLVFALCYGLFSILYMLRAYAQVEFRLRLKFKEYFYYYCIVSIGYLAGFGLYILTKQWLLIFVVGEMMALAYSLIKGTIFKREKKRVPKNVINKTFSMIVLSTLVRDCVIQFDKVILKQINANVVTEYHVVSLMAKTIQMLIQPINTLIMSYLTAKDAKLSRKTLVKFTGISFVLGALFYCMCIFGTPIFVKIFYSSLYVDVIQYNLVVNLGLILGFLASLFMAVILSQGRTLIHTTIECVWGGLYIIIANYFVKQYAIWGLGYVTLVMNVIKVVIVMLFLFLSIKKNENRP